METAIQPVPADAVVAQDGLPAAESGQMLGEFDIEEAEIGEESDTSSPSGLPLPIGRPRASSNPTRGSVAPSPVVLPPAVAEGDPAPASPVALKEGAVKEGDGSEPELVESAAKRPRRERRLPARLMSRDPSPRRRRKAGKAAGGVANTIREAAHILMGAGQGGRPHSSPPVSPGILRMIPGPPMSIPAPPYDPVPSTLPPLEWLHSQLGHRFADLLLLMRHRMANTISLSEYNTRLNSIVPFNMLPVVHQIVQNVFMTGPSHPILQAPTQSFMPLAAGGAMDHPAYMQPHPMMFPPPPPEPVEDVASPELPPIDLTPAEQSEFTRTGKRRERSRQEWTPDEEERFLILLKHYHTNFAEIARRMPNRTQLQVRTHYRYYAKVVLRNLRSQMESDGKGAEKGRKRGRPAKVPPVGGPERTDLVSRLEEVILKIETLNHARQAYVPTLSTIPMPMQFMQQPVTFMNVQDGYAPWVLK